MERGPRPGVRTTYRDRLPSSSRYELLVRVASGGMATVYVGRKSGAHGFSREVAIKRAHAHLLEDPAFTQMLVAEAKLAAKIRHPNVVSVEAVEELDGELLLVMEYVEGATLSELTSDDTEGAPTVPAPVAVRIVLDASAGLHAAHNATDESGRPLGIVHRDVTPHNIIVGADGIARVVDFGIAKASVGTESHGRTATGALKGKVPYMAPEYVERGELDQRSDVFALGVVTWEALAGRRLFRGGNDVEALMAVLATKVPAPSSVTSGLGRALDEVVLKALARDRSKRWPTALAYAEALETSARAAKKVASHAEVAAFVKKIAGPALASRRSLIAEKRAPTSASSIKVVARADATGTMGGPVEVEATPESDGSVPMTDPAPPPVITSTGSGGLDPGPPLSESDATTPRESPTSDGDDDAVVPTLVSGEARPADEITAERKAVAHEHSLATSVAIASEVRRQRSMTLALGVGTALIVTGVGLGIMRARMPEAPTIKAASASAPLPEPPRTAMPVPMPRDTNAPAAPSDSAGTDPNASSDVVFEIAPKASGPQRVRPPRPPSSGDHVASPSGDRAPPNPYKDAGR